MKMIQGTAFIHVIIHNLLQIVTQTATTLNVRLDKSAEITSVKQVEESIS